VKYVLIGVLLLSIFALLPGCSTKTANITAKVETNNTDILATGEILPTPITNQINSNEKYRINFPESKGSSSADIELKIDLPKFPETMMVFKMTKPEITEDYVRELGAKFDITGEVTKFPSGFIYEICDQKTSATLMVSIYTGALFFNYKRDLPLLEKPDLPSSEEAMSIATEFLDKKGLLPQGLKATKVIYGLTYGNIPQELAVTFKRNINGCHYTGPGNNFSVRVGDKGKVVDMMIYTPQYEPDEELNIKTVEQAFEELKTKKKYSCSSNTRKIEIDSITTDYYLIDMEIPQDYITPVYVFSGLCRDVWGNQLPDRFTDYVEAVK
jgi:hypothetical protein